MPAVGNNVVFELVVNQVLGGQEVANIWYFTQTDAGPVKEALRVAEAFRDEFISALIPLQTTQLQYTEILAQQLGSLTNYGELGLTGLQGASTQQSMASFVAWKLDILRTTKETRQGAKRIAGLVEADVAGNYIEQTQRQRYDAALAVMNVGLIVEGDLVPLAIVGGKIDKATGKQKDPQDWVYQIAGPIRTGYIVTTQNSRKVF